MQRFKIIVKKHVDGYVAYPLGLKAVVGGGDTRQEPVADAISAIEFHIETFGPLAVDMRGCAGTSC